MLPSAKTLAGIFAGNEGDTSKQDGPRIVFESIPNQFVIHARYKLDDNEIIEELMDDLQNDFRDETVIHLEREPHISLIYGHYAVQYHQILPFIAKLSQKIKPFRPFSVRLNDVRILPNSNGTRNFIAVCDPVLPSSKDHRIDLIKAIHQVLKQYRSEIVPVPPEKLENFLFHTSLVGYETDINDPKIQSIHDQIVQYFRDRIIIANIDCIHLKVGHIERIIRLDDDL